MALFVYSLAVLGFCQKFMGLMRALYSTPEAWIRHHGFYSEPIKIAKGTRQDCSLSQLIFAIAKETLAIAIRTHPDIAVVKCGHQTHTCGPLADDLLLFIASPLTSLPIVCKLLDDFSKVSGLQVNLAKSQAMNISLQTSKVEQLKDSFQFDWGDSSMHYVVRFLTPKIEQLYAANYICRFSRSWNQISEPGPNMIYHGWEE